jgi:hypothetical protein
MAIYHLHASTGSRNGGQSAGAKSDYIKREGKYTRDADEVLATGDGHMPAWAADDARVYWQAADAHERANGRLFKEVEFALPVEMTLEQQQEAVERFAAHLTDEERMPYSYAIHAGKGHNPHCHLMISERANDGHDRSAELWFKRAATGRKSAEEGGARKTESLKPQAWLEQTREDWAEIANAELERHGYRERIDNRTLEEQGIDRRPQVHIGPTASAMAERGIEGERTAIAAGVQEANRELAEAQRWLRRTEMAIDATETAIAEDARRAAEQRERDELQALAGAIKPAQAARKAPQEPKAPEPTQPHRVKAIDAQIASQRDIERGANQRVRETAARLDDAASERRLAERDVARAESKLEAAQSERTAARAELGGIKGLFKGKARKAAQERVQAAEEAWPDAIDGLSIAKLELDEAKRRERDAKADAKAAKAESQDARQERERMEAQRERALRESSPARPAQGHAWSRDAESDRGEQRHAWSADAPRDRGSENDGPELG